MGTGIVLAIALTISGVFAKYAADMYKEQRYRELWGALFWATLPVGIFCLFWVWNENPFMTTRIVVLTACGAVIGAALFNWAGYLIGVQAQSGPPQNTVTPGNSTSSTGQQGGITAGSVGAITVHPPAVKPDNRKVIGQIAAFIEQGEAIANAFVRDKDSELIKRQYSEWFTKVNSYLRNDLDAAYAAQFRNAPAYPYVMTGMASDGSGAWQNINGKMTALNQLISELRR